MSNIAPFPKAAELPIALGDLILDAALLMAKQSRLAFRIEQHGARGATLRPGRDTPLWNELRAQVAPHLVKYGDQAKLARLLGLPRQRVNSFVKGGSQMPDAERTLQLLAWLIAVRHRPPA
jgi:hypothetical protein